MQELTYILGAGASFQSIPVVKSFSNRFKEFLDWIDIGVIKGIDFSSEEKQKFGILHNLGEDLHQSFRSHQSFDTYFKKLFHTGQNDKISQGKKVLNLYFTWEHLSKPTARPDYYDEDTFWKQSSIDKRYDALIAGLLKPLADKKEPYCKINFITWNYDLNLLMSLKNYFLPEASIGEFFKQIDRKYTWEIEDKICVINMNGFFYSSNFSGLINLNQSTIHDIIYDKIKDQNYLELKVTDGFLGYGDNSDRDAESIKFAWETKNFNSAIAKNKIGESKNIVIIGYTFPLYNRSIDLEYFYNDVLYGKRLILQDPNSLELESDVIENFSLKPQNFKGSEIVTKVNCDNFFIPNDIFQ